MVQTHSRDVGGEGCQKMSSTSVVKGLDGCCETVHGGGGGGGDDDDE